MDNTNKQLSLSSIEVDAIGEVLNISMGAAATAVSSMLDKMVTITTPNVDVEKLSDVQCGALDPAILVKITYTDGIDGSNVMVFRQKDMQVILNQLMGIDEPAKDDFVFDELSMSAACEVMNQMMGAAATALAEFLGRPVNISTPEAAIMTPDNNFQSAVGLDPEAKIISVLFHMDIQGVMNTEFISVLPIELAKMIVSKFIPSEASAPVLPDTPPAQQPVAPSPVAQQPQTPPPAQPQQPTPPAQQPPQGAMPMQPQQPGYPPMQEMPPQGYGQMPMQGYPPYPPQGYGQYPPQGGYPYYYAPPVSPVPAQQRYDAPEPDPIHVKNVQFPDFTKGPLNGSGEPIMGSNVELLMNVPLNVAIEIGQTKKKIRDIMNFAQGTVIELEKQAGAPIDIVVNGQLIAHGDVVVIDDNFGVRITEIVGTKELLNALEKEMQ